MKWPLTPHTQYFCLLRETAKNTHGSWHKISLNLNLFQPTLFRVFGWALTLAWFCVCSEPAHLKEQSGLSSLEVSKKPPGSGVVSPSLTPLALPSKPESVVSITSQCSYSSTIVHVGDKKGKLISFFISIVSDCVSLFFSLLSVSSYEQCFCYKT